MAAPLKSVVWGFMAIWLLENKSANNNDLYSSSKVVNTLKPGNPLRKQDHAIKVRAARGPSSCLASLCCSCWRPRPIIGISVSQTCLCIRLILSSAMCSIRLPLFFSVLNSIFQIIEIDLVIQFGFRFVCCNT